MNNSIKSNDASVGGDGGGAGDGGGGRTRAPSFKRSSRMNSHEFETVRPEQKILTPDEKVFLLNVERGDVAQVKRIVQALGKKKHIFDVNCVDPLGRSAVVIAIENENIELVQFLLESGIELRDSLLVAIREDYVDGVECLLLFEEQNHKPGTPYSWESIDQVTANFTPDITPLTLAAQRNNYEILKMLLDRGATIPMPHDVKCSCDDCVEESANDSLRFSLARINAYKALASPSLIALSSKDPILTAFELSNELKRLSVVESQFKEVYGTLRKQVQELATGLVDHARTSYELEVLLNHNPDGKPWIPGEFQTLERLKLAIEYNQKKFVSHPSVQQLLAAIWYDGLPGFRRMHVIRQLVTVLKHACLFPVYSLAYLMARGSAWGQLARKPFVKFITTSSSYLFFLFLLALASQRVEYIVIDLIVLLFPENSWTVWLAEKRAEWVKHERGSLPTVIEMAVITWVQALVIKEIKLVFKEGLVEYLSDMWNLADIMSYGAFLNWIGLRGLSFFMVHKELWDGVPEEQVYLPRDQWKPFDPHLLAEGMFGAGMISSFLKVIHIFSINPYLGPLQVSLGKMVIDIAKWLILYILVLFSFGCGLNQLLWYYADLEKQQCYSLPGGLPDFDNFGDSCVMWRRFANLWETSQSLFWASFGLVELGDFELKGIKEFTRFWGLLMFGSYSVCNIIVLLNMLIAMMSNSYTIISARSDMEWKFARSKLWISYFCRGNTVAPPLNLIPTPRGFHRIFKRLCCKSKKKDTDEEAEKDQQKKANSRYYGVVRCLVRRYITDMQRKSQDFNITEDDINEVRQDIRSFRYELINILKMNDMKTPNVKSDQGAFGKKSKDLERMIAKGFNLAKTEGGGGMDSIFSTGGSTNKNKALFKKLVKAAITNKKEGKTDWNEKARQSSVKFDPIGSTKASIQRRNKSFRRSMLARGNSQEEIDNCIRKMDSDQLLSYNPLLKDYTPATRIAYAKFKTASRLKDIKERPSADEQQQQQQSQQQQQQQQKDSQQEEQGQKEKTKVEVQKTAPPSSVTKTTTKTAGAAEPSAAVPSAKPDPVASPKRASPSMSSAQKPPEQTSPFPQKATPSPQQASPSPQKAPIQALTSSQTAPTQALPSPRKASPSTQASPAPTKTPTHSSPSPKKTPTQASPSPTKTPTQASPSAPKASPSPKQALPSPRKASPKQDLASRRKSRADIEEILKAKEEQEKEEEEEEEIQEDPASFDPKGKSVSTGRNITGWI